MKYLFTILLASLFATNVRSANPNAPSNLRTCDKINPAGTNDKPFFGWYTSDPDQNEIQTAYQIIIATSTEILASGKADIWDSGKTTSRTQNYVDFNGKVLQPGKRYFWKVRTWDKDGNVSLYSSNSYFDTGLFKASDWQGAVWIRRTTKDPNEYTYFRKKVELTGKKIKSAMVYLSAYHNYEFYIDGKIIGKGLAYHYPQYSFYKAYDVTKFLTNSSTLSALTHWYGGGQGRPKGDNRFLLKLVVTYADDTKSVIGSDKTWKQTAVNAFNPNTPKRNGEGIGYIDVIDSRKTIENWNLNTFNDANWQNAEEIGVHPSAPFTGELEPDFTELKESKIRPVSVNALGNGTYVIDLGKIYAGVPEIQFDGGKPGDTVRMHGGFVLNDNGSVSEKINQSTNLSYQFVLNGGKATFKPFVYLGYQYLQVDHSPIVLNKDNVGFTARYYELQPERAYFSSSNPMLNKVYELMAHTLTLGAQEGFVDTPTREKGAFLSDGWSQGVPAMEIMGERALNHRALLQFLDSQDQYWPEGQLNAVYPNADGKRDIPDFTQQYLLWVWDYYMITGNTEFIRTNYEKLKKVAKYVDSYTNKSTGLIHQLAGGSGPYKNGIIDWPDNMRYGYDMNTESRTIISAYAYADFDIIAKIASVIGNKADSELFQNKATAMRNAINTKLINNDGVYIDGLMANGNQSAHISQHANMFPIALGIIPEGNRKAAIEAIKDRKMSVGMVTVRFLPQALGLAEEGQQLLELYSNTTWDGWAKNITQGATATWESWNALDRNDSMCHPWGTSGLDGIQKFILGVTALKPQHELIQIKPLDFKGKLTNALGTIPTDKGDIKVSWERTSNSYKLTVISPNNINAQVYLPTENPSNEKVTMNGKTVAAKVSGNFLLIENVGSGKNVFESFPSSIGVPAGRGVKKP